MTKDEFQKAVDDVIEDCIRNDYSFSSYARKVTDAVWPVLEAAERERDWHADRCEDAMSECASLRAKIEAMEKQEPYAFAVNFPESSRVELVHDLDEAYEDMTYEAYEVRKLYLAPGAQTQGEEK